MTHTLHREGPRESLEEDYEWLVTAVPGVNDENLLEKKLKLLDIVDEVGAPNYGCETLGNLSTLTREEFRERLKKEEGNPVIQRIRGVFSGIEQVKEFLIKMKEADLGLSVVITGLYDRIFDVCEEIGLTPHSIHISLGVWGNTDLLPSDEIMEITTMCGHSLISPTLVTEEITDLSDKDGEKMAEEMADKLKRICRCGVFNQVRGKRLLQESVEKTK